MIRSEQERTRIVRAWLDEGSTELTQQVLDGVLIELPTTPQDRPFGARWSPRMSTYAKIAAATAAVVVAFIAGTRFAPEGGPGGGPGVPSSEASPSPSAIPTPTPAIDYSYRGVGFIGLPPLGAAPSGLGSTELLDTYVLPGTPFKGAAYLYADGRLIWFEYTTGNEPYGSTGYLEQRLNADGVELVQALAGDPIQGVKRLDFRNLSDRLPEAAWQDVTIRPYVPSGFAACIWHANWEYPFQESTLTLPDKLAMLPAAAADFLRDRELVHGYDGVSHCLGMTTAEARQLDEALRGAGLAQDEWRNGFILEYHAVLDSAAPKAWRIEVWFEPILPDGTIGCTSCG
jgi:hypothetical protein